MPEKSVSGLDDQVRHKMIDLKAYPLEMTPLADHVAALQERFLVVGKELRSAIAQAADAGDADSEDIFTEVSRAVDKDAWFIGSNAEVK